MDAAEKVDLVERVMKAKAAAHFNRADRQFEFTGPQMEELSLSLNALVTAFVKS